MEPSDFSTLSPEQIAEFVRQWSPKQMACYITHLTPAQLEAAGKNISYPQASEILAYISEANPQCHWQLSPLLVGMPHTLFSQLLLTCSPRHLEVLKLEAMTEPVQHHLTLLTHEITYRLPDMLEQLGKISNQIELLSLTAPDLLQANQLRRSLRVQAQWYEESLNMINKVLIIAWNTNRTDLIDKLSQAKEWCQRALTQTIGKPKTSFTEAEGLYGKLNERLAAVYGNPPSDIEAANDDEPAIEGLAKFALWYLQDYHEVGLLPSINPAELDLDPATHSEQERLEYREKLMDLVKGNLAALGLETVKDLKQAGIYSSAALKDYIAKQK